eukprot:7236891-Alexandrium_andersonii.AAC.1
MAGPARPTAWNSLGARGPRRQRPGAARRGPGPATRAVGGVQGSGPGVHERGLEAEAGLLVQPQVQEAGAARGPAA